MLDNMENMKILSVLHITSKPFSKEESRKVSCLSIRVCGTVRYTFDNREIVVNSGEMIFLPKGSRYVFEKISDEDTVATIISIEGDFGEATPAVYSVKNFYGAGNVMYHFADMWNFGTQSQRFQCISLLYSLLSYISGQEALCYHYKKRFGVIEPAVTYLNKHIYDSELQIDKLHLLCGISHTYFRKVFISRFGSSPKNYVVIKRLSYAKTVIDSGEFTTVKELAQMAGYNDPLYFGKIFKKH